MLYFRTPLIYKSNFLYFFINFPTILDFLLLLYKLCQEYVFKFYNFNFHSSFIKYMKYMEYNQLIIFSSKVKIGDSLKIITLSLIDLQIEFLYFLVFKTFL